MASSIWRSKNARWAWRVDPLIRREVVVIDDRIVEQAPHQRPSQRPVAAVVRVGVDLLGERAGGIGAWSRSPSTGHAASRAGWRAPADGRCRARLPDEAEELLLITVHAREHA